MSRKRFTKLFQLALSIPIRLILILFSGFIVTGKKNMIGIDRSRGVILAANHNSQLDSIFLSCSIPLLSSLGPVYFVSLEKEKYQSFPVGRYFYGGRLFELLGAYSIKQGLKDYAITLSKHIELLVKGKTVAIYPEGARVPGYMLGEAHGGVAYLAKVSGAPIIPVAITGDEDIHWHQFFTFQHKIKLIYGTPIYFEDIDESDLPEEKRYHIASQKVMRAIEELLKDIWDKARIPKPMVVTKTTRQSDSL
ncbi:MAG TPA: lysophospholipid acyltransferase family protein [Candidatus Paceibacterota bacterium]